MRKFFLSFICFLGSVGCWAELTNQDLTAVNTEIHARIDSAKTLVPIDKFRLYAYLAQGQLRYACLNKEAEGNFGPVSLGILGLFIPSIEKLQLDDAGQQVIKWAKIRLEKENKQLYKYPIREGENFWRPEAGQYMGLGFGSILPWYLTRNDEFHPIEPPQDKAFWSEQIAQVKTAMAGLNSEKRAAILFWAGMQGEGSGDWVAIAENYMAKKATPLEKRLALRALLLSALVDSKCATYHAKYTFWVKRPSMQDLTIQPVIDVPSHPSYPAAHSSSAGTAATILSAYFPENKQEWDFMAKQSSLSRQWAGIHLPIDLEVGQKLGEQVGQNALSKFKQCAID